MPETFEYPKGIKINKETIVGLGGDDALEVSADEVRKRLAVRDAGAKTILERYRKENLA